MGFTIELPVGACADTMELEYIAALHQTDDSDQEGWLDASIEASDVKYYLLSRHGIDVSKEVVRRVIFSGLAGGDGEDDCIDIPETVAILIIPFLTMVNDIANADEFTSNMDTEDRKMATSREICKGSSNIISDVLKIILCDTMGSSEPRPLTKELLYSIFARYEELDLIKDDNLVDEMIKQAAGGGENTVLDSESFSRALTGDINLLDIGNEDRTTTHFEDVFGVDGVDNESDDVDKTFKHVFVFPQIDFLADTFRSKIHFAFALLGFVFTYAAYFNPFTNGYIEVCAEESREKFGCQVGLSIVTWIVVMVSVIGVGLPIVTVLNLGNNPYRTSLLEMAGGLIGTGILIFVPAFVEFNAVIFRTDLIENANEGYELLNILFWLFPMIIGSFLAIFQITNIIQSFVPSTSKWLSFFRGKSVKYECDIKRAAACKVNTMVMNAYHLHKEEDNIRSTISKKILEKGDEVEESSNARALLNFTKQLDKTETTGGFFWCWKEFLSNSLRQKEGVWVHSRMLTANFLQIMVTIICGVIGVLIMEDVAKDFREVENLVQVSIPADADHSCESSFGYTECNFPENESGSSVGFATCLVSYSDSCQFTTVDDDVKDLYCGYFDEITLSSYGFFDCPELEFPYPAPVYSYYFESNEDAYCGGALTVCTPISQSDGMTNGLCIIGVNSNFVPYQFAGTACTSFPEIDKIIKDNPVGEEEVEEWRPEDWMFKVSFGIGIGIALLAGLYNAAVNVPSIILTTLKFRSGILPSLRDVNFKIHRANMLLTTSLIGATFWGSAITSLLIIFVISVPLFLLLWPVTSPYMLALLSTLIGIIATLLFKVIMTVALAKFNFAAFYRKNPVVCNLVTVAFECWNLALTVGFVLARATKLILISIVFIGRFDKPVLAEGVGMLGPINLDNFPMVFRKDLLATDAHRHPYIERLGLMYMMKLQHGDKFGTQAGSIWRLLFVFALMPWLKKYRIFSADELAEVEKDLLGKVSKMSGRRQVKELEDEIKAKDAKLEELENKIKALQLRIY